MPTPPNHDAPRARPSAFATTHWSVVLKAGEPESPGAREALETLCQAYWYPLYAYARKRGSTRHDAQDLVQGFFAQLLRRGSLRRVSPDKGRFRSFLLAAFDHHAADEGQRANAAKRGGGRPLVSINADDAEQRYGLEPVEKLTPRDLFDRRWALTVIERALEAVESSYRERDKIEMFRTLKDFLLGDRASGTYAEVAARLGSSEGAIKMAVARLRRHFRERLRDEVAQTVFAPGDVQAEIRHLLEAVGH